MQEKSVEFVAAGGEVYLEDPVLPAAGPGAP